MAGKIEMEKRWGYERGTGLHDRALEATKKALSARGYDIVWDNGFECEAGVVDLIAKDDQAMAFVDVFVNDDPAMDDFPANHARYDLGKIESSFKARIMEAEPLAWDMIPNGRAYFQFHFNVVAEDRAVMRSAETPVCNGVAKYTREEGEDPMEGGACACADERAVLATVHFLEHRGWEIVDPEGFECEAGAVDLVAEDDDGDIVLVKVSSTEAHDSLEKKEPSFGRRWFERVLNAFCREHDELLNSRIRFDCVNVISVGDGKAVIWHHRDAFSC